MHDEKIRDMKKRLCEYICSKMDSGLDGVDTMELGQAIDMVKDLAEAEKYCHEADYYRSVHEAMEDYGENPRMGYPRRRDSMGRFKPNRRMGYDEYPERYANPSMDPTPDGQRINHRPVDDRPGYTRPHGSMGMRYDERDMDRDYDPHYGEAYNGWRSAKRHYTETHSEADKMKMREKTNQHMADTMATLRDMWDEADPELRKRMKADLTKLTQEMA